MKKNTYLSLFLGILLLICCRDPKGKAKDAPPDPGTFNTVVVGNRFQLSLPAFMKSTTALHGEASLQYQNIYREAYTVVLGEPKDPFVDFLRGQGAYDGQLGVLENYRKVQLMRIGERVDITAQGDAVASRINGLVAETVTLDAQWDSMDQELSYRLTFIEGEEYIYMVMSWTLKDKKGELWDTFGAIAESFALVGDEME